MPIAQEFQIIKLLYSSKQIKTEYIFMDPAEETPMEQPLRRTLVPDCFIRLFLTIISLFVICPEPD